MSGSVNKLLLAVAGIFFFFSAAKASEEVMRIFDFTQFYRSKEDPKPIKISPMRLNDDLKKLGLPQYSKEIYTVFNVWPREIFDKILVAHSYNRTIHSLSITHQQLEAAIKNGNNKYEGQTVNGVQMFVVSCDVPTGKPENVVPFIHQVIKHLSAKKKQPSSLFRIIGLGDFNQKYPCVKGESGEYKNTAIQFDEIDGKVQILTEKVSKMKIK